MKFRRLLDLSLVIVISIIIAAIVPTIISIRYYHPQEPKIVAADLGLVSLLGLVICWLIITLHENAKDMLNAIRKPPRRKAIRELEESAEEGE